MILTAAIAAAFYPTLRRNFQSLDQSWAMVDFGSLPEVQRFQALLRIDTTADFGSEITAAEYLAAELEAVGIAAHIERLPGQRANLWAAIEGERPEALVLHNHLDTDPIGQPERWTHPPFGAELEPPWIYGRGAFDMKSVTIAQLETMRWAQQEVERTGRKPERSLIFLATSSEETGSDLGTRRLLVERPELVARAWAVFSEGGVLEATDLRQIKYWGTSFVQKQFVQLRACSGSRERLDDLYRDLRERGQVARPRLTAEARAFVRAYGPTRDETTVKAILADPEVLLRDQWSLEFLPTLLQALFRDEIHPFPPEPSPGGGFQMRVTLHVLPGGDIETARRELLPQWLTHGVAVEVETLGSTQSGSPLDHPAFTAVSQAIRTTYGTEAVGPYFLSFYANDCRFFAAAGIPCYGFTPFLALTTDSNSIRGPNERIALPAFVEGVELYREVARSLLYPKTSD